MGAVASAAQKVQQMMSESKSGNSFCQAILGVGVACLISYYEIKICTG